MTKSRGIHDMHGGKHTRAYGVWCSMRSRCNNPNSPAFANYGGRGISVDPRWNKFSNFIEDMGHPADGMTLERVDNDKGYSKENCIWADRRTQGRNTRRNVLLTINGETKPLCVFAERSGIAYKTVHQRLNKGWTPYDAVTVPLVTERAGISNRSGSRLYRTEAEMVLFDGEQMTLKQAAERAGLSYGTVYQRVKRGWAVSDALNAPSHRGKRDKGANRGIKFHDQEELEEA